MNSVGGKANVKHCIAHEQGLHSRPATLRVGYDRMNHTCDHMVNLTHDLT